MFLTHRNDVFDFDLPVLVELLKVIDKQIAKLEVAIAGSPDPDGFGECDRLEAVVGLGFVACQQYINATYGQLSASKEEKRWQVVGSPPMHSCGESFVALADAAANYWKHADEWRAGESSRHEVRTRKVLNALTPSTEGYGLSEILQEIVRPAQPRFASVIHELTLWRDLRIKATA